MFKVNKIGERNSLKKVSPQDMFDDIQLVLDQKELKKKGYIFAGFESVQVGLFYMAKPSKELSEFITRTGRRDPDSFETLANGAAVIDFGLQIISPLILGKVDKKELDAFKKTAKASKGIVSHKYEDFKKVHPNYALSSVHWPEKKSFESIKYHARNLWKAVGYSLNNDEIKEKANNGEYDEFYLEQDKINFLSYNFNLNLPKLNSTIKFKN